MREAGELARATSRGPFKRWTKGDDNSPVTEADIAVNDLLRARLSDLVPGAGWLSEETEDAARPRARRVWVVDPIDGTRAFIAGRADWTHFGGAGGEWPAGLRRALCAGDRRDVPRGARRRRHAQRRDASPRARGGKLDRRQARRPQALSGPARAPRPGHPGAAAGCIRWRCGWRAWRTANSMPRSPRPAATTGTLRRPTFWCTKPAA